MRTSKVGSSVLAVLMVVAVAACAPSEFEGIDDGLDTSEEGLRAQSFIADSDTGARQRIFYMVTGRDYRKCAAPACGGFFVKAVNQDKTLCADGTKAAECYVSSIDYAALGLHGTALKKFATSFEDGAYLGAGSYSKLSSANGIAKLVLHKGYRDISVNDATGTFYRVARSGLVCITFPCPTLLATRLNVGGSLYLHDVNFSSLGISQDQIDKAWSIIDSEGLIISGNVISLSSSAAVDEVPGAIGHPGTLVASDFFTEAPRSTLCLHDGACGVNESCDMSVCLGNCPPGAICPAVCWGVCEPRRLCLNDSFCSAGEYCDMTTCYNDCPPGMACPAVCKGMCRPAAIE